MLDNNKFYNYDIQVRDMIIKLEGYPAEKIYSYLKEKNGFVEYKDDAVQLPEDLTQRLEVLDTLTTYLNIHIQETIIGSEYQQDYQTKIAPKINSIDKLIALYKKKGKYDIAVTTLEDLTCDLSEFKNYMFFDEKEKQNNSL